MSSDLQSQVVSILQGNYVTLIGVVVVGYDYILALPREIDYIWRRRWTWVSAVFILVRYPGLCWAMLSAGLIGTSFLPGPVNVSSVLFLVSCWTFPVFICAADLVMILCVYSMWHRSKRILYALLSVFAAQVIVSVVLPAIYNSSTTYFTASVVQVLDYSFCAGTFSASTPALLGLYSALPRFALSIMLLALALSRTMRELSKMYHATKRWQPNRYGSQFTRDGTYYFIINTVYNVVTVIGSMAPTTSDGSLVLIVLGTATTSLLCSAMPRFIIAVRELYDRDLRGRRQEIDTGFGGVLSQDTRGDTMVMSGITFVDGSQSDGSRTLDTDADDLDSGVVRRESAIKEGRASALLL